MLKSVFKAAYLKLLSAVFLLFVFVFVFSLPAEDALWELGGKSGWNAINTSENIAFRKGRYGFYGIGLSSNSHELTDTDLLLSFDDSTSQDSAGFYSVVNTAPLYSGNEKSKYGEGALVCEGIFKHPTLVLRPKENAFFAGGSSIKSFTIEFWLNPENTESGGRVFNWRSSLIDRKSMMYQNIAAEMANNRIQWSLLNIWRNKKNNGLDIKISGKSNLIPAKWSHHLLTFDEFSGILEYRINGKTENIIYITETGKENGGVLYSMLGSSADVFIGIGYSGLIDEFKISKKFTTPSLRQISEMFEKYGKKGGFFQTEIIDTGGVKSAPQFLNTDYDKPEQTEAAFFIRAADSKYLWTQNYPEWTPVCPKKKIENVEGRFIQIACSLYPDSTGEKSPVIHSLKLQYEKDTLPLASLQVFAKAGDGEVNLTWTPSIDFDVKGYLVYIGDQKGQYLLKNSPIDAGNRTSLKINGLENGKLYFFSVAAYDENGKDEAGNFSKEVWARPVKCP